MKQKNIRHWKNLPKDRFGRIAELDSRIRWYLAWSATRQWLSGHSTDDEYELDSENFEGNDILVALLTALPEITT